MKARKKFILLMILLAIITCCSLYTYADEPNPPIVPPEHGAAGDVPLGAPVDGGLSILLLLGAGYGAKKLYSVKETDKILE